MLSSDTDSDSERDDAWDDNFKQLDDNDYEDYDDQE